MADARRPTINAVAAKAGVSRGTVGMILSGKDELFREATITLVREAALALGYRPNAGAQSTRTGRTGAIGLLRSMHTRFSLLSYQLLDGIEETTDHHKLRLSLARFSDEELISESFVPELLRSVSVDGLLIHYTSKIPQRMRELIESHHVPAIWMNIKNDKDAVHPDDRGAGAQAAQCLIDHGHSRIGYLDYTMTEAPSEQDDCHYSFYDRAVGVQQQCLLRKARYQFIGCNAGDWMASTRNWLRAPGRPTAVIINGSAYTNVVIHTALALGLRIPEDLSLIMLHNNRDQLLGRWPHVLQIPEREMGRVAVEMLIRRAADKNTKPLPTVALPFTEFPGDTVGPPADE